jgi:hypothetical protein
MADREQVTLTTSGRRSGRPRTVTLYAFPDGVGRIVVGSHGGADVDPAWVERRIPLFRLEPSDADDRRDAG